MHALYMDCSFGISGDMMLAALHGLGVNYDELESRFRRAGVTVNITPVPVTRNGIAGFGMDIRCNALQPLRHLKEMADILDALDLSDAVTGQSRAAFTRLAEAEAAVHGVSMNDVHFHEVGGVDTLVDVIGTFWGLEQLQVREVVCSALPWFRGTVTCAHGTLPLPAPATLRLLDGKPVYPTAFTQEMITPTGALLVDAVVSRYDDGPHGLLRGCGLGYGTREDGGALRLLLLDECHTHSAQPGTPRTTDVVTVLESNVDHLTGEELGHCFDALMEAGALDVMYLPGVMKKNRPAGMLRVLCTPDKLDTVQTAFFHHTYTLGIRRTHMERVVLPRTPDTLETPVGPLAAKTFTLDGRTVTKPEYEALAAFARKTGRSLPELRAMLSRTATDMDESSKKD